MSRTTAHLFDPVISHEPVWRWVLPLPIPWCLLLAKQPKLLPTVLQVVHRVIARFLLRQAGVKAGKADSCAVTLIGRFGSAANLNVHLHCLVLGGVCRRDTDGAPEFVEVPAPSGAALQTVLHKFITRTMKPLTLRGGWSERRVRPRWPTTTVFRTKAACWPKGVDGAGCHAQADEVQTIALRRH